MIGKPFPTRPEAVLFDWDNTLVDTWGVIHDAITHTLSAMGHPTWTMAETKARVRKSMRESFPQLFGDRWHEAEKVFYDRFKAIHIDLLQPADGAESLLQGLRRLDLPLGVVSNKTGAFLREEAAHLGWDDYFGRLVGAKDAARDKPAREPIDLALETLGVAAGPAVWFVGDTDIDLVCAVNAGCTPVLVRPEAPDVGEFADAPPAVHVPDCRSLLDLLEKNWTPHAQSA